MSQAFVGNIRYIRSYLCARIVKEKQLYVVKYHIYDLLFISFQSTNKLNQIKKLVAKYIHAN